MRTSWLLIAFPWLPACATIAAGGGSGAPAFQGEEAVKKRIEALNKAGDPALKCLEKGTPQDHGIFEVTADSAGKVIGRTMIWSGAPEIATCIVETAGKITLAPLAGPSISSLWPLRAKDSPPPPMPKPEAALANAINAIDQELSSNEVQACAQRHLPPEFPADVEIGFFILPGGKPAAATVMGSNAKDGGYEACVQQAVMSKTYPDPHYDGPFPYKLEFHVGGSYKI